MSAYAFDYLSGAVNIPAPTPDTWQEEGLTPFYENPNNAAWGDVLCRVLYHESVHFWQFLSSGYIANLVAGEWNRLNHFERTDEIIPQSKFLTDYSRRIEGNPFSAYELVECWARYWDVHTRSPERIIRKERIKMHHPEPLEAAFKDFFRFGYTGTAFDTVMQHGQDCTLYAEPYRWMLERASGHSAFVAITFPIIAHHAFGSSDPVGVFCKAFDRAKQSSLIQEGIRKRSGNINLDWLDNWAALVRETVLPVLREGTLPPYTSGFEVIKRGPLCSHPIFREYLEKGHILQRYLKLMYLKLTSPQGGQQDDLLALESHAVADMPQRDPWVVFGLPGQPNYRYLLGLAVPPPIVRFENFTYAASRAITLTHLEKIQGVQDGEETYEACSHDLGTRIRRFRAAEKAVSLGLPPNTFER